MSAVDVTDDEELAPFFFGVSSLDRLLDPSRLGYGRRNAPFVGCISGADGVGKSILGLHAASTYSSFECGSPCPVVLYASTDLSIEQARATYSAFSLDKPQYRRKLLSKNIEKYLLAPAQLGSISATRDSQLVETSNLSWLCPYVTGQSHDSQDLQSIESLFEAPSAGTVHFLDLAKYSAGDDWGLLNRLTGLLPDMELSSVSGCNNQNAPKRPHLLIIDAVEGLEALVGDRDAFGLQRSRRSRLAQLVRVAKKANCTIIFIVEQRSEDIHLDEVFVSDLVIRLRTITEYGYQRKAVEIEKARGVAHIRGQHDIQVRKGNGCDSGGHCPDEPIMNEKNQGDAPPFMAYPQVLQSLDVKIREPRSSQTVVAAPAFGIKLIDERLTARHRSGTLSGKGDPRDQVVVVVGETGTFKGRLGVAFLSRAICDGGRALLITTEGTSDEQFAAALKEVLGKSPDQQHTLLRSISPRFISSAGFMFRVQTCIRKLKNGLDANGRIAVVVDNWSTLMDTHPALGDDPRLLQSLVALFRDEGVQACILATQPGSPSAEQAYGKPHDVRQLEVAQVHVWPVDFFGSRRIAVSTSIPGLDDAPSLIHELRTDPQTPSRLEADDHFALYEHLEQGTPRRINLQIKLYSGEHELESMSNPTGYSSELSALFKDLFPSSNGSENVIQFKSIERYDGFKEFVQSLGSSQLNESLVFQVDEFWTGSRSQDVLADMSGYIDKAQASAGMQFRQDMLPDDGKQRRVPLHRDFGFILADRTLWHQFADLTVPGANVTTWKKGERCLRLIDGLIANDLPFLPSFDLFQDAQNGQLLPAGTILSEQGFQRTAQQKLRIGHVWNALALPADQFTKFSDEKAFDAMAPTWSQFLAACEVIGKAAGRPAFDVDTRTSETLTSVVLEMWFSSIIDFAYPSAPQHSQISSEYSLKIDQVMRASQQTLNLWRTSQNVGAASLRQLVTQFYPLLYATIRRLRGHLPRRFGEQKVTLSPAAADAVCFRTWFAPAVLAQSKQSNLTPLRNPGRFSVRGDWYLGVARGSRSSRLANLAVEKLASPRMNLRRMREGVGLPVFDGMDWSHQETALTARREDDQTRQILHAEVGQLEQSPHDENSSLSSHLNTSSKNSIRLMPLFRSRIQNYEQDSGDFFHLVCRILRTFQETPTTKFVPGASDLNSDADIVLGALSFERPPSTPLELLNAVSSILKTGDPQNLNEDESHVVSCEAIMREFAESGLVVPKNPNS